MGEVGGDDMSDAEVQKHCVVVPAYREGGRIGAVVSRIRAYCDAVVVVDDGSEDGTAEEAEMSGAVVIRHTENKGKGAALSTGFEYASKEGFEVLITMDADGQHDAADIPSFVREYEQTGTPVLVGTRMGDAAAMPVMRRVTNKFMSWLLSREMGQHVPDTQCGYRLYRCDVIPDISAGSERFAAESETLLEVANGGTKIGSVPIRVIYSDEKSKINPVKDTFRFISMLRRWRKRRSGEGSASDAA